MSTGQAAPPPQKLRGPAVFVSRARWADRVMPAPKEPNAVVPGLPGFATLLQAYQAIGGTAHGDSLGRYFQQRRHGDIVSLARLIISGQVFGFEWRHTVWVPMFQFELDDLSIKAGPRQVRAELAPSTSGWPIAAWFVQANTHLNGRRPVDLLDSDLAAVVIAARSHPLGNSAANAATAAR